METRSIFNSLAPPPFKDAETEGGDTLAPGDCPSPSLQKTSTHTVSPPTTAATLTMAPSLTLQFEA